MKLRIHDNSIRLRLSRSEVSHFELTGYIADALDFGAMGKLNYSLRATEDFTIHCIYDSSSIQLRVPREMAQQWTSTDREEMSAEQSLGSGKTLQILVEKDFQCLHKNDDANSDAYPNPASDRKLAN